MDRAQCVFAHSCGINPGILSTSDQSVARTADSCIVGGQCDDANDDGECDDNALVCSYSSASAATVCRSPIDLCNAEVTCTGSSVMCPVPQRRPVSNIDSATVEVTNSRAPVPSLPSAPLVGLLEQ